MSSWKTSLAGYLATAAGIFALLADSLPPKYAMLLLIAGQILNGVGNVLSQDAQR
jgi:hypothetical protein